MIRIVTLAKLIDPKVLTLHEHNYIAGSSYSVKQSRVSVGKVGPPPLSQPSIEAAIFTE